MDEIRLALQRILDAEGDGWSVTHYAVVVGIERMTDHGEVESTAYVHSPDDQPAYVTSGLVFDGVQRLSADDDE